MKYMRLITKNQQKSIVLYLRQKIFINKQNLNLQTLVKVKCKAFKPIQNRKLKLQKYLFQNEDSFYHTISVTLRPNFNNSNTQNFLYITI